MSYGYPGNIRELKNTCERLVILTRGELITPKDIQLLLPSLHKARNPRNTLSYQEGLSLREMVEQCEREIILSALQFYSGHVTNTAKALQIERSHLYKKAKSLDIDLKS